MKTKKKYLSLLPQYQAKQIKGCLGDHWSIKAHEIVKDDLKIRQQFLSNSEDEMQQIYLLEIHKIEKMIFETGKTIQIQEQFHSTEGEIYHFLTTKKPLKDKIGNIIGINTSTLNVSVYYEEKIIETKKLETQIFDKEAEISLLDMTQKEIFEKIKSPLHAILLLADFSQNALEQLMIHPENPTPADRFLIKIQNKQIEIIQKGQQIQAEMDQGKSKIEVYLSQNEPHLFFFELKPIIEKTIHYLQLGQHSQWIDCRGLENFSIFGNDWIFQKILIQIFQYFQKNILFQKKGKILIFTATYNHQEALYISCTVFFNNYLSISEQLNSWKKQLKNWNIAFFDRFDHSPQSLIFVKKS